MFCCLNNVYYFNMSIVRNKLATRFYAIVLSSAPFYNKFTAPQLLAPNSSLLKTKLNSCIKPQIIRAIEEYNQSTLYNSVISLLMLPCGHR